MARTIPTIGVASAIVAGATPNGAPIVDQDNDLPLRSGYVRFASSDVSIDLPLFGEPTVPVAESGWETVQRPNMIDLTVWRSGKPLTQDVPIHMDVLAAAVRGDTTADVSDEWLALEKLWRPAGGVQSPAITISGPVGHADRKWIIVNIAPDEEYTKRIGKRLVRVRATVSLQQYVASDLAGYADPDTAKGKALSDRPRFAMARQGDTLRQIAKRELGSGRKWVALRKLNPAYKTASAVIAKGTQIRLPNGR